MEYAIGAIVGLVVGVLVTILLGISRGGGSWGRLGFGLELARKTAADAGLDAKVRKLLEPPPPPKPDGTPVRILALLQQEGRLIDFLMDDITTAEDAQIGAAVREIHGQIRKKLAEHLVLEPVMSEGEGSQVTVPAGFDPSAVRVIGHVAGDPPYKGTLQHAGWRVKEIKIPEPAEGQDQMVLMPAEVEVPEA